jgi:hypothetical protein
MANNPVIGRWKKQPYEELRYEVDWSQWLLPGENLKIASFFVVKNTVEHPLEISSPFLTEDSHGVIYFLRGGQDQIEYQVTHRVTTTGGQQAEREIIYTVEEV